MGLTPFLVAAGVGFGGRGTGLAAAAAAGGTANLPLMELLLQHGADVNARVTDTKTYSMRIARSPSATEGQTALHAAAQSGRAEVVKFLLEKGANPEIVDANGKKAIDLISSSARGGGAPAGNAETGRGASGAAPPAAAAPVRGGAAAVNPASAAEIRTLLQGGGGPVTGR
jgi:hypothetical protein